MNPQNVSADQWEIDWANYVDSLASMDRTRADRFKRGKRRAWNNSKSAHRKAVRKLRKADAQFCDRQGII
jgi:hypothetical protein